MSTVDRPTEEPESFFFVMNTATLLELGANVLARAIVRSQKTDVVLLANVAQRAGLKKLLWDGARFTNDAQACEYLSKPYRKGWEVA